MDWPKIDACALAEQLVQRFRELNPAATHYLGYSNTGGCWVESVNP